MLVRLVLVPNGAVEDEVDGDAPIKRRSKITLNPSSTSIRNLHLNKLQPLQLFTEE
jgi:hypothetical protein